MKMEDIARAIAEEDPGMLVSARDDGTLESCMVINPMPSKPMAFTFRCYRCGVQSPDYVTQQERTTAADAHVCK